MNAGGEGHSQAILGFIAYAAANCCCFMLTSANCHSSVQVVRDIHKLKLDPCGEPVEALLTRDLKHQSIMKTMSHAWWRATDRGGSSGEQQCWMILEYCDGGSVVVSKPGLLQLGHREKPCEAAPKQNVWTVRHFA